MAAAAAAAEGGGGTGRGSRKTFEWEKWAKKYKNWEPVHSHVDGKAFSIVSHTNRFELIELKQAMVNREFMEYKPWDWPALDRDKEENNL